jgi:hypothetical protein
VLGLKVVSAWEEEKKSSEWSVDDTFVNTYLYLRKYE